MMSINIMLACFMALVRLSVAGYALEDSYTSANFFDEFSFFTAPDPTHGFVNYVDKNAAQSTGLVSTRSSSIYMGVDHTNLAPSGRNSVRLVSNKVYTHGLFILDVAHMPIGCGTWPAFWTVGPDWPNSGEIDIIEGVNSQNQNQMTLHTSGQCQLSKENSAVTKFSGNILTTNCTVEGSDNIGCGIKTVGTKGYGAELNSISGGIYATEWTSKGISIWWFPRNAIPSDITAGKPDVTSWGMPTALFEVNCNIDDNFKNHNLVFDTTFCGDWAGDNWGTDSQCASKASTCSAFVANNPAAFADAYWSINSLKVYKVSANAVSASSSAAPVQASSTVVAPVPAPSSTTQIAVSSSTSTIVSVRTVITTKVITRTRTRFPPAASVTASSLSLKKNLAEVSSINDDASSTMVTSTTSTATSSSTSTSSTSSSTKAVKTKSALLASWFPSTGTEGGIPVEGLGKTKKRHAHAHAHRDLDTSSTNSLDDETLESDINDGSIIGYLDVDSHVVQTGHHEESEDERLHHGRHASRRHARK